jgi:serine/threonine-protein kinase
MTVSDQVSAALAGRYRIDRELGRGGMATVYLAHDLRHDRPVAIKTLHAELWAQLSAERFLREIRVTAQLTHPQILPLLDSGSLDGTGQPFYVMPYVAGETLLARLKREGPLTLRETARIVLEIADALDYAHSRGVIHRDIKPENILLLEGHAVLADFGIAHAIDVGSARMTSTGTIVGTPMYMSPEQGAGDRAITGHADQYSLACVAYEMLTGSPPFIAGNSTSIIAAHALTPPPSARSKRGDIPPAVDAAIQRAMAKDPDARFPTASAFASALTVAPEQPKRRARGWMIGASALVVALAAAFLAYGARRGAARTVAATRIAVLPFRSVSPDPNDGYFADGMTDEMISALSSIGGLTVIARSSVDAYARANNRTAGEIGKALAVGSLLDGSVRKDRSRVRISVALSDPTSGESRWSATYDTTITDVFAIQRSVATAVAKALRVALLQRETRQLDKTPTTDSVAYVAYLRARALVTEARNNGFASRSRMDSATRMLRIAVERDPDFALGWAALANQIAQSVFAGGDSGTMRDSALTAVTRALALDTSLAEGYRARSNLAYTRESGWRNEESLRDALHAVALKPSWAEARATLASMLIHIGFQEDAERELEKSIALDPESQFAPYRQPRVLWQSQRFAEALNKYEQQRRTGPTSSLSEEALVLGYLGRARDGLELLEMSERDTARRATERVNVAATSSDESAARAVLLARLGRADEARTRIADAQRLGSGTSHFHHAAFAIATAWALMNQRDSAVTWLERTADDGMPSYSLFLNDPTLESLRGVPRYQALMQRLRVQNDRFRDIVRSFGGRIN